MLFFRYLFLIYTNSCKGNKKCFASSRSFVRSFVVRSYSYVRPSVRTTAIESGLVRVPSIDVGTSLTTVIDLATTCQILSMPYSKLLADCHPKRRMKAFKDQFL